jgi:hypothetical protein
LCFGRRDMHDFAEDLGDVFKLNDRIVHVSTAQAAIILGANEFLSRALIYCVAPRLKNSARQH